MIGKVEPPKLGMTQKLHGETTTYVPSYLSKEDWTEDMSDGGTVYLGELR